MVRILRRVGATTILVSVMGLGVGGCIRHTHDAHPGLRTGSIKDDYRPVVSKPRKPVVRAAQSTSPPLVMRASTATAPQALPLPPLAELPKPTSIPAAPAESGKPSLPTLSKAPAPAPTIPSASAATPSSVSMINGSAAAEPPLPPTDDPAIVAELLAEGQALFDAGQVVQARRRFIAAMNGPVPEVLLALARSYDTYYLGRLPSSDAAPDMQRSLVLYERALARGAPTAEPDLERTRNILKVPR